jgi:hypothetical protein
MNLVVPVDEIEKLTGIDFIQIPKILYRKCWKGE